MRVLAGTSGFSYAAWRGSFYPEKLPASRMLAYYAEALPAVEINNTFYRMPSPDALARWAEQVPASFRFAIKAPRRITHVKRLADCSADTERLLAATAALGERLGSILFQTPPSFALDLPRLERFVRDLPAGLKAAFEFRHASWLDESVSALLAERHLARVSSETDESESAPVWTADWGYLRLRKSAYSTRDLRAWADRIRQAGLREAQVFFKHEDRGVAPALARAFLECVEPERPSSRQSS